MPPLTKDTSILIIGSGTFGISTALHLARRGYTNITCLDRHVAPSVDSAGYDLNKIIRTEYDDPFYTKMALEALDKWRGPEFKDIFHETGRLITTSGDPVVKAHLRQSYENLLSLGQTTSILWISTPSEITSLIPQLAPANLASWTGLFNAQGGWAHAKNALEKWATRASQLGVSFISGPCGTMVGLETRPDGSLAGVKTKSGDIWTADRYILSTGAASPALLPELAPHLWSKCWTVGHIELTDEELSQWKGVPVIDHFELGFAFEPDPLTRRIKICDNCPGYQNRRATYKDAEGKDLLYSVPRYASDYPDDGIPKESTVGIRKYIEAVMPQFKNRPLVDCKVCWCTDSPDAHFLVDNHPVHPELLLATGDSGHAFKMFPIIGDYIADALEGKKRGLKPEWKFGERKSKQVSMRPNTEIKDLQDVLGKSWAA